MIRLEWILLIHVVLAEKRWARSDSNGFFYFETFQRLVNCSKPLNLAKSRNKNELQSAILEAFRLCVYGTIVGFTPFDLDVLKNRFGFDLDVWFMVQRQVNLTKYQGKSRFDRKRNGLEIYEHTSTHMICDIYYLTGAYLKSEVFILFRHTRKHHDGITTQVHRSYMESITSP